VLCNAAGRLPSMWALACGQAHPKIQAELPSAGAGDCRPHHRSVCLFLLCCSWVLGAREHVVQGVKLCELCGVGICRRWALGVVADCLEAAWPAALLEHEMGEEVAVGAPAPVTSSAACPAPPHLDALDVMATSGTGDGGAVGAAGSLVVQRILLFRGLRIK
jgi:hypothetical protein